MSDEPNIPIQNLQPEERSSGASNPIPKLEIPEAGQQSQSPEESEGQTPPELPKILESIYGRFVRLVGTRWGLALWVGGTVFLTAASSLVTVLWTLALWDSYHPKITVMPGGTLNAKSPFATYFIIQNQGSLSIANITYLTRLEAAPLQGQANTPQVIGQEQNVTVIPEMGSLESYSLSIHYGAVQIKTGPPTQTTNQSAEITNQVATAGVSQVPTAALMLTFEISYDPKWYFKRVEKFHFFGLPDVDGNWQWLPTAHQNVTDQIIDTNLIARFQQSTPNPPKNDAAPTSNPGPVNAPPSVKVVNGAPVHTQ